METVNCNYCGSDRAVPLVQVPDLLLGRTKIYSQLVSCEQCGLVYQNPRPTLVEMGEHYPADYEPYVDVTQQGGGFFVQKAWQYGIRKRTRYVTRHRSSGRLLDVGCAAGTFLLGMRATGVWDVHGVEINGEVAEFARRRYGIDIIPGTLEAVAYPAAFFDAVTMWDVLEHLHDPSATLREIHRILKPGGILVVRVPNLASWDATLFGRYWAGLDAPRHLYVFSPTTLSNMLAQNRYAILEHSCAIGGYPTFALSARFWLTGRRASGRVQRWANRILYHPLTRLASAPLFYLSSRTLRGPLLVTVARKE